MIFYFFGILTERSWLVSTIAQVFDLFPPRFLASLFPRLLLDSSSIPHFHFFSHRLVFHKSSFSPAALFPNLLISTIPHFPRLHNSSRLVSSPTIPPFLPPPRFAEASKWGGGEEMRKEMRWGIEEEARKWGGEELRRRWGSEAARRKINKNLCLDDGFFMVFFVLPPKMSILPWVCVWVCVGGCGCLCLGVLGNIWTFIYSTLFPRSYFDFTFFIFNTK